MVILLKRFRHFLHKFVTGYYNLLLIFLTLLFIFRPYDRDLIYLGIWKIFLSGTFLTAIFNCNHNRVVKIITFILAVPTVLFSWINILHHEKVVFVLNASLTIIFMMIAAGSILYDVVLRARVTLETLRGVICAYFMIAFAWGYIYYLIEFISPGSFHLINRTVSVFEYAHYLSEMFYFSFVTLLTIGYGDITAVNDVGQTAAVIEGIIGQFYVAILVARLVSVYAFYSDKKMLKTLEEDMGVKRKGRLHKKRSLDSA